MSDGLHTFHCRLTDGLAVKHVNPICDNQYLHKLTLIGEIQMKVAHLLPSNIVVLELKDSILKNEDPMIALGALAHLRFIRLSNSYLGTALCCMPGSFPQLEEFFVHNFKKLITWRIENGAMKCLKKLEISWCKNLQHLPQGLVCLSNLQKFEFFGMSEEFSKEAREYKGSRPEFKHLHKFEAIIDKCDNPIEIFPIDGLYRQLTYGVFLNDKHQASSIFYHL